MWGVCVSVLYVCMFVCEDVYVTFKTSYKHKTRPRNNWCAPHRSAARGAFICLYSTLPTRLWICVKQMWTFQVRTKVSIYSSPKHKNMNFLRQQCRPICGVYLFILHRTRKTCTFLQTLKDYYCGEINFHFHAITFGRVTVVTFTGCTFPSNRIQWGKHLFLHAKTWRNIKKRVSARAYLHRAT